MDLEVAVDKLNDMTLQEIIDYANELDCIHVTGRASLCIIANILRDMTGREIIVAGGTIETSDGETIKTPDGLREIISIFDEGLMTEVVDQW